MPDAIKKLTLEIVKFRDEREWSQFHNGKDLAIALSIEANELLERFLWKQSESVKASDVEEELADVLIYALLLAVKYSLDVESIVSRKLLENAKKYPVDKSKGSAMKYDEL